MTPDAFVRAIEVAIRPEVTAAGGVLEVCEDEVSALLRLEEAPSGQWVMLLILAEGTPGEAEMGRHDCERVTLQIYIGKPAGLPAQPAAGIYRDTAAGRPLLSRVQTARTIIQRCVFVEQTFGPEGEQDLAVTSERVDGRGWTFEGWRILGPEEAAETSQAARLTFSIPVIFDGPDMSLPIFVEIPQTS